MKAFKLKEEEFISGQVSAKVTYHSFTRGGARDRFSLRAGSNVAYHHLASSPTSLHSHDFPEVFLVISGKIRHIVNGEVDTLEESNLVFVRPDDQHCFEVEAEEDCELVNLSFSLDLLLGLSQFLGNDLFMRRFTAPPLPPVFPLSVSETDRLGRKLLSVNSPMADPHGFAQVRIKAMIADLFIRYFLEHEGTLPPRGAPSWLERVCLEMREKRNFVKGLPHLRKISPCTKEHLCKIFRRHLGKSPTEYVNELRINHAAAALADTDEEIYAICLELGFESVSRFYHLFKKQYGVSPARYRKRARRSDIPISL